MANVELVGYDLKNADAMVVRKAKMKKRTERN